MNQTWSVIPKPKGASEISAKWVFKITRNPDNSVDKYKARLVARGFIQREGRDFKEVFAPVVRMDSIRLLFSICVQYDLDYIQFDIATAFLNGTIEEVLYLKPPEGVTVPEGCTLKLNKSLYGLRQAPRAWNTTFTSMLKEFNLKPTDSDACVSVGDNYTYLAIYVDDGVIFGKDKESINRVLDYMRQHFNVKIISNSCFIGVEVKRYPNAIMLHQGAYIKRMLTRYGMENCKGAKSPLEAGHMLNYPELMEKAVLDDIPYAAAVGSLLYCALATRPDITHSLSLLSKYTKAPREAHWKAIKRVFRYLQATSNYGLLYRKIDSNLTLDCYTYADWGGDQSSRRSMSGMVLFLGTAPVSYHSQQQLCVALSTTEAEYIAASDSVKSLIWVKRFLKELGITEVKQARILCDNQGALKLIRNPEFHRRTKHIDIRFHFIRDQFLRKVFEPEYICTEEQKADLFTKALTVEKFCHFRKQIGCIQMPEN